MIMILLSSTLLSLANEDLLPKEDQKRKISGIRLTQAPIQACTPHGYSTPCLQHPRKGFFYFKMI